MEKDVRKSIKIYIPLFILLIIVIIAVIIFYITVEHKDKSFTNTFSSMGVQIHQMIYGNDAEVASGKVRERIQYIEDKFSYDIDDSDIDRVNRGAGEKWVKCDSKTLDSVSKLLNISRKSYGVIDPTILPLVYLWGIDKGAIRTPNQDEIDDALSRVDYRDIKINYEVGRVKLDNSNASMTLKQIEKGAACSTAVDVYKDFKVDYGVVSVGGVVGVYGKKPDNSLWKISVRDPFIYSSQDIRIAVIKIQEGYVASFGVRDDKISIDGMQCNKILNVKTGYPVVSNIALVSVVHPDAIIASALSQICCVLDREESFDILNYYGGEAIFVYNDKSIYVTPNIRNNFVIIDPEYSLSEQ